MKKTLLALIAFISIASSASAQTVSVAPNPIPSEATNVSVQFSGVVGGDTACYILFEPDGSYDSGGFSDGSSFSGDTWPNAQSPWIIGSWHFILMQNCDSNANFLGTSYPSILSNGDYINDDYVVLLGSGSTALVANIFSAASSTAIIGSGFHDFGIAALIILAFAITVAVAILVYKWGMSHILTSAEGSIVWRRKNGSWKLLR